MAHDVFISYSSHDKPIADAICAGLEAAKIRCWVAPRDVLPGVPYGEALIEALGESQILLLVFSSNSNRSAQVMREVENAVDKGIPILPFRIEDVRPSASLDYFVKAIHWLDAITPPLEQHLQSLAGVVRLLLTRQQSRTGAAGSPFATESGPTPGERAPTAGPAALQPPPVQPTSRRPGPEEHGRSPVREEARRQGDAATAPPRIVKATPLGTERSPPAAKPSKKRLLAAGAGVAVVLFGIGLWASGVIRVRTAADTPTPPAGDPPKATPEPGGQSLAQPDQSVVVPQPAEPTEPAVVSDIGIVLDKGTFATDAIFTNRHPGPELLDVEFTVTFTADGSPLTGKYDSPITFNLSKAASVWKNGETLELKNFATYDFTRVSIVGSCTIDGKPAKIIVEKTY